VKRQYLRAAPSVAPNLAMGLDAACRRVFVAKTGQRLASFFGRLSFPDLPAIDRERRRDRWRDAARHLVAVTAAAVTTVSRFCHACARVQNL